MNLWDNTAQHLSDNSNKQPVKIELEIQSDARLTGELPIEPYKLMLVDFKMGGGPFELCLQYQNYHKKEHSLGLISWDTIGEEFTASVSFFLRRRLRYISIRRRDDKPQKFHFTPYQEDNNDVMIDPVLVKDYSNIASIKDNLEMLFNLERDDYNIFIKAIKMYHAAIVIIENQPELSYLLLVFSIEILSKDFPIKKILKN